MSDVVDDMAGWITLEAWCEKYGEDLNTIQKRVQGGAWDRGDLYSTPDGGQGYVHEARAKVWLERRGKLEM